MTVELALEAGAARLLRCVDVKCGEAGDYKPEDVAQALEMTSAVVAEVVRSLAADPPAEMVEAMRQHEWAVTANEALSAALTRLAALVDQ